MMEFLAAEGYAVVASALTQAEVNQALEHTWQFIEGAGTGVDRCDVRTWGDDRWPLGAGSSPFASPQRPTIPELGHSPQLWHVRGCPGVKAVWAAIHETEDLITSFDGMSIYRPWTAAHEEAPSWRTNGPWFHTSASPPAPAHAAATASPTATLLPTGLRLTSACALAGGRDQGPYPPPDQVNPDPQRKAGFEWSAPVGFQREYVQGFVNLVDNSELTGGNCVVRGSHVGFEAAVREHWTEEGGLSRPWEGEELGEGIIADCRAGDIFLWCG